MGGEVPRVPERPAVGGRAGAPAGDLAVPGFGSWYRTQRELRGVATEYVADRTKLALQRITAIERDEARLRADGQGRLTARALAEAIGADVDEAVRVLVESADDAESKEPRLARFGARGVAAVLALALCAGAGWWLADRLLQRRSPATPVQVIHRPDYVKRALEEAR